MNSSLPHDFPRLSRPLQDLRPEYEDAVLNILRILWNRRYLIVLVSASAVAFGLLGASLMTRTYVSQALIQVSFDTERAGSTASAGAGGVAIDAAAMVEGEAEIIRSRTIAQRVLERIEQTDGAEGIAEDTEATAGTEATRADRRILALQEGLSVMNDGRSYLIRVVYAAEDPERAALIANAFAEEYLQSRIEVSYASARRIGDWLAGQLTEADAAQRDADDRVRVLRAGPDALASGADGARGDQQLNDLIGQIAASRIEQLKLDARLERLREAVAAGRTPSAADLAGSTDAQQLIDAEVAARREASRVASTFGVRHPLYGQAETALETARTQLGEAVKAAIGIAELDAESARAAGQALAGQLTEARRAAGEREAAANQLRAAEAEASAARLNVERLRENHRQALALAELKPIMAQMVSPATPLSVPASPKKSIILVISAVFGMAASLAIVFLLHLRDVGFVTAAQVFEQLGIVCAGLIPDVRRRDRAAGKRVREQALKSLVVACGLTRPKPGGTVVVVTSAVAGEGKTDLVRALAETLASLNRRVLIVENAGRRQAEMRPVPREDHRSSTQAVTQTRAREGSGPTVALYRRSTTELADVFGNHDRLQEWLDESRSDFDVVIVEASAVLVDAEAVVVSRAAHLVLFAARWNATPRKAVAAAVAQLTRSPGQETAVVLTGVDLRRHRRIGQRDGLYFLGRYSNARGTAKAATQRGG